MSILLAVLSIAHLIKPNFYRFLIGFFTPNNKNLHILRFDILFFVGTDRLATFTAATSQTIAVLAQTAAF